MGNQPQLKRYLQPLLASLIPGFHVDLYRAKVVSGEWQSKNMFSLTLKVSRSWGSFNPGQHILVTLNHNGRYISRPFSISSSLQHWQQKQCIRITCRVNNRGELTPLLSLQSVGEVLNISRASGDFGWQDRLRTKVLLAAGSGITPLYSMLMSQVDWKAPVILCYRFRSEIEAAFLPELRQLAAAQPLFTLLLSDSSQKPWQETLTELPLSSPDTQYLLCGPSAFMQQTRSALGKVQIPHECIFQEQFGPVSLTPSDSMADNQILSVLFTRAGSQQQAKTTDAQNLLQIAEQQGLNPSFGCRMGVCYQCVCQKVSGQIRDLRTGKLSTQGEEQIQLCVSQPVTNVVIEY